MSTFIPLPLHSIPSGFTLFDNHDYATCTDVGQIDNLSHIYIKNHLASLYSISDRHFRLRFFGFLLFQDDLAILIYVY